MGILFSHRASPPSSQSQITQPPLQTMPSGPELLPEHSESYDVKVLFLGPGESGKTTFWRHLRYLFAGGISEEEIESLVNPMKCSLLEDILTLIRFADTFNLPIDMNLKSDADLLLEFSGSPDDVNAEISQSITAVWNDPSIRETFRRIQSTSLSDHSAYFLDSASRIASDSFWPSKDDILRCRIRTTGVSELGFRLGNRKVCFSDVGGQKNERKKWMRLFTGVNIIIFVVSLSDFDIPMFEDEGEKKTTDSLALFKSVADSSIFQQTPIFLLLNKKDELERRIKEDPPAFRRQWPSFSGNLNDLDRVINFVSEQYIGQLTNHPKESIKCLTTCAVNAESVKDSFSVLVKSIDNMF